MKQFRFFSLVLALFVLPCFLMGQGWLNIYGDEWDDAGLDILNTTDGGFITLGKLSSGPFQEDEEVFIMKLAPDGEIEWTKTYGEENEFYSGIQILQKANGNFLVFGQKQENSSNMKCILFEIDQQGNKIWQQEYQPNGSNPNSAVQMKHIGDAYILLIHSGMGEAYLLKIDLIGNLIWEKSIPFSNFTTTLRGFEFSQESEFFLIGYTSVETDIVLIKLDEDGNLKWQKEFGVEDLSERAYRIIEHPNGNFVFAGIDENKRLSGMLDSDGNIVWWKTYKNTEEVLGGVHFSVNIDTDGDIWYTGYSDYGPNFTSPYLSIQGVNEEGDSIFFQAYEYLGLAGGRHIISTDDGGKVICGALALDGFYGDGLIMKIDSLGHALTNNINGVVFKDNEPNCSQDTNELGLNGWIVETSQFYSTTDIDGVFNITTDSINQELEIYPPSQLWDYCTIPEIEFNGFFDTVSIEIGAIPLVDCPYLEIDLTTLFLRRCFPSTYYVNYCNNGTISADSAYAEIVLDTFLTYLGSSIPLAGQSGDTLTFQLDTVDIGECGNFTIEVEVSCDAELGQTHCTEAYIFPDSLCLPAPSWSGGQIEVNGVCANDTIFFNVQNVGTEATSQLLDFIVIEDDVILLQGEVPILQTMEVEEYHVAATGSTYRMEAEQEPNFPGGWSMPSATVEACGSGGFSFGFTNQFPQDDASPFLDIDCRENIGSYDPNDKLAFPTGWGSQHFIEQNTDLEYLIRFQNTGTDTAFRVVLRDTLSPFLDPATVRPGAASHPYQFDLVGPGVLKFTFDDILLPDSTTNLAASQGFVKFRISQKTDVPLTSVIENSAAIFFDFNAPIITNTTWHTVGQDLLNAVFEVSQNSPDVQVKVTPNPFSGTATLTIEGLKMLGENTLRLFDGTGRLLLSQTFSGEKTLLDGGGLPAGVYFFQIKNEGGASVSGKAVLLP